MDNQYFLLLALQIFASILIVASVSTTSKLLQKLLLYSSIITITGSSVILALNPLSIIDPAIILTLAFWVVSLKRIEKPKYNHEYIKRTVKRDTRLFLLFVSLLVLASAWFYTNQVTLEYFEDVTVAWLSLVSGGMLLSTLLSLSFYGLGASKNNEYDLPSVTLAIPARNETHALDDALKAALASDYEKLEIIVLDDCSQDETAKVIKSYAHKGVRFVQGEEPAASWLGKNQAYKTLLQHASGEYILFCGVDVNLSVGSLTKLITNMLDNNTEMVSVLPQRLNLDAMAHIIQPMRYFWQLAIPRFIGKYPPVLSSCWAIKRDTIHNLGDFDAVKNSIIPESYFARKLSKLGKYQYIVSDINLGITTRKKPRSQLDTAIRTLYPMLKRSFALSWIAASMIVGVFVFPFVAAIVNILLGNSTLIWIPALIFIAINTIILTRVAPAAWFMAIISFPVAMLSEAVLILTSAIEYEYGEISWKGRNVCVPVMKQYEKLPGSGKSHGPKR